MSTASFCTCLLHPKQHCPAHLRKSPATPGRTDHAPDVPEAVLQRLILARLNELEGVAVWRNNTGVASTARGGAVRFGTPGQADITGILRGGRRLEVEVKTLRGRVSPAQRAFGERITSLGGLYIVARCLDDVLGPVGEALAKAGA